MRRSIRLLFVLIFVVCCCAQEKPSPGTPKFTARTELVTVPVVIVRDHKFVEGLKQDDFTVLEDGKAKRVAFFEEVKAEPQTIQHAAAKPGEYTNLLTDAPRPAAVTIILIDHLLAGYSEQGNARNEVMNFLLRAAGEREPTMVADVGRSGLKIVHDFTTSREVLLAALKEVRGKMEFRGPSEDDLAREADAAGANSIANAMDVTKEAQSLEEIMTGGGPQAGAQRMMRRIQEENIEKIMLAFEQLAFGLRGVPGRKTLVWVSPGFECPFFASMTNIHGEQVSMGQQCVNTWRELSAANFAVYQVNPMQTENPAYAGPAFRNSRPMTSSVQRQMMNESLTTYTGGTICSFRSDLYTCFKRAVEDSSRYYMLSYYAIPTEKPTWRKIQVKVNVPKVSIRARSGYITAGTEQSWEERRKNDIAVAVASPIEYTGVAMTVKWLNTAEKDGKRQYRFQIMVPPGVLNVDENEHNHLKLSIIAYAMDAQGGHVGDLIKDVDAHLQDRGLSLLRQQGFGYTDVLKVPPGNFTVKFILRDDLSGRMGTVTAPTPRVADRSSAPPAQQQ